MSSRRLGPVETKVKGSTLGAGSSSVLVAFLVWVLERYNLLTEPNGALDPVVVAMIALVVSAAGAFAGGYVMPHMDRQAGMGPRSYVLPHEEHGDDHGQGD